MVTTIAQPGKRQRWKVDSRNPNLSSVSRAFDLGASQSRFVKIAMGLDSNTQGYIWRMEAGRNSIEIEARNRIYRYLGEIYEMSDERWPKIFLKEELRGINNNNPSIWGKALVQSLKETGDGETLNWMQNGVRIEKIRDNFQKGVRTKKDHEIQED